MLENRITKSGVFEGVVLAKDWNEVGHAIELVLVSTNKEEIPIYMNLKAESLTEYCKEKMRIRGSVISGFLHINTFKFLKR